MPSTPARRKYQSSSVRFGRAGTTSRVMPASRSDARETALRDARRSRRPPAIRPRAPGRAARSAASTASRAAAAAPAAVTADCVVRQRVAQPRTAVVEPPHREEQQIEGRRPDDRAHDDASHAPRIRLRRAQKIAHASASQATATRATRHVEQRERRQVGQRRQQRLHASRTDRAVYQRSTSRRRQREPAPPRPRSSDQRDSAPACAATDRVSPGLARSSRIRRQAVASSTTYVRLGTLSNAPAQQPGSASL